MKKLLCRIFGVDEEQHDPQMTRVVETTKYRVFYIPSGGSYYRPMKGEFEGIDALLKYLREFHKTNPGAVVWDIDKVKYKKLVHPEVPVEE